MLMVSKKKYTIARLTACTEFYLDSNGTKRILTSPKAAAH
ncbi:hypothetical protein N654_2263 [Lactiplantibacillus plantarum 4_3]|nr:hypothetical protein N654_2263 [Lactiplantibacillus plantarum 4_3]KFL86659.1 hypothetical protein LpDm1_2805 [Lactiplantibacillus plantarum]KZD97083.1 hypothetical protein FBR6_2850 [Lactiplantibacillus plantarum]KZU06637.1 hypothetical protein Nizo2262_1118 [Lactiplantibacillus plantarum]KZU12163.1 hypothetical protein CNW10_2749 [Lactiplantibacillus plantarum]